MKTTNLIIAALLLALGIATAGFFISKTIYNSKVALNTAEAKGLAERRVKADIANWNLGFSVTGEADAEIADLYKIAQSRQDTIIKLLKDNGFSQQEVEIGVIDYQVQEYRDDNQQLVDKKHYLIGSILVETEQVELVAKVRAKVNSLVAQGIEISNNSPTYRFTKLNEIKPDMLREATENAKIAANEFAQIAGVKVGGIRNARQGNFYIRDAGEDYGDTRKIEKDVRVVTTITFYLTDKSI